MPLEKPLIIIAFNVQNILDVYQNFPETGLNLLAQVNDKFTKEEYEQILNDIRSYATRDPNLKPLFESLNILRKHFGDDPAYIAQNYLTEIAALPGTNKFETFQRIIKQILSTAIENVTVHVQAGLAPLCTRRFQTI